MRPTGRGRCRRGGRGAGAADEAHQGEAGRRGSRRVRNERRGSSWRVADGNTTIVSLSGSRCTFGPVGLMTPLSRFQPPRG